MHDLTPVLHLYLCCAPPQPSRDVALEAATVRAKATERDHQRLLQRHASSASSRQHNKHARRRMGVGAASKRRPRRRMPPSPGREGSAGTPESPATTTTTTTTTGDGEALETWTDLPPVRVLPPNWASTGGHTPGWATTQSQSQSQPQGSRAGGTPHTQAQGGTPTTGPSPAATGRIPAQRVYVPRTGPASTLPPTSPVHVQVQNDGGDTDTSITRTMSGGYDGSSTAPSALSADPPLSPTTQSTLGTTSLGTSTTRFALSTTTASRMTMSDQLLDDVLRHPPGLSTGSFVIDACKPRKANLMAEALRLDRFLDSVRSRLQYAVLPPANASHVSPRAADATPPAVSTLRHGTGVVSTSTSTSTAPTAVGGGGGGGGGGANGSASDTAAVPGAVVGGVLSAAHIDELHDLLASTPALLPLYSPLARRPPSQYPLPPPRAPFGRRRPHTAQDGGQSPRRLTDVRRRSSTGASSQVTALTSRSSARLGESWRVGRMQRGEPTFPSGGGGGGRSSGGGGVSGEDPADLVVDELPLSHTLGAMYKSIGTVRSRYQYRHPGELRCVVVLVVLVVLVVEQRRCSLYGGGMVGCVLWVGGWVRVSSYARCVLCLCLHRSCPCGGACFFVCAVRARFPKGVHRLSPVSMDAITNTMLHKSPLRVTHGGTADSKVQSPPKLSPRVFERWHAATVISSYWRGVLARERVWGLGGVNENHQATNIARVYRGMVGRRIARKRWLEHRTALAIRIQAIIRGRLYVAMCSINNSMHALGGLCLSCPCIFGSCACVCVCACCIGFRNRANVPCCV